MNSQKLLQKAIGTGLVLLLLVGCSNAPVASTATPTLIPSTPTPALPGAAGTPMIVVSTPSSGFKVVDAYMSADDLFTLFRSGEKPSSALFPSGVTKLYVIAVLCPQPKGNTSVKAVVSGVDGTIDFGEIVGFVSLAFPEGCVTVGLDAEPKSGSFPDGPYQTTISIDGKEVVLLNWSVGSP